MSVHTVVGASSLVIASTSTHAQSFALNIAFEKACWQDFEWVTLAMMPMFLFSTTFFPLGVYPRRRQLFVESTPLFQRIEIVRGLMLGAVAPALLGRAAYLAISSRRLGRLLPS